MIRHRFELYINPITEQSLQEEMEIINIKTFLDKDLKIENRENQTSTTKNNTQLFEKINISDVDLKIRDAVSEKQSTLFLKSMKKVIMLGQCLGLNPVMGILQSDPSKMRFHFLSWKCIYSLVICAFQLLCSILCIYQMCRYTITIMIMAYVSFYATATIVTTLFIRIAKIWPRIIHEISQSHLDEYVDHRVKMDCSIATIVLLILALVDHILAQIVAYTYVLDCTPKAMLQDPYKNLCDINFGFLFNNGIPYSLPLAIFVQILNTITLTTWSYSDIFVICVSLYLSSIFYKINKKIEAACNKACQPWMWRSIREHYTRATQLVRVFDDVISGVIFVSFANNLFYICLQLYNVFQHILADKQKGLPIEECPNFPSGPFNGYEKAIYYTYSLSLAISRFLAVSLMASRVHSSALQPAAALYGVPTQHYYTEIQRFIEQIHSDEVALSGLKFFYVTKSLILSVAGTIVTYELVLLQFEGN